MMRGSTTSNKDHPYKSHRYGKMSEEHNCEESSSGQDSAAQKFIPPSMREESERKLNDLSNATSKRKSYLEAISTLKQQFEAFNSTSTSSTSASSSSEGSS